MALEQRALVDVQVPRIGNAGDRGVWLSAYGEMSMPRAEDRSRCLRRERSIVPDDLGDGVGRSHVPSSSAIYDVSQDKRPRVGFTQVVSSAMAPGDDLPVEDQGSLVNVGASESVLAYLIAAGDHADVPWQRPIRTWVLTSRG